MSETKDETIVTNVAPEAEVAVEEVKTEETTVEEAKAEQVDAVVEAVAEVVSETVQDVAPETVEAIAVATAEVATEAVEAVAEAVAEAPAQEAPMSNEELDKANAKIEELTAKIKELTDARDAEALQNRINAELAKYPTLQNRAESEALLKLDWDLGVKFLASIKPALAQKTVQNRVPAKTPDAFEKMTATERIKAKMFNR